MGISLGGSSALVTPRDDIGLGFDEIDVEAMRMGYVGLQIAPIIEANVAFGQFRKMKINQWLQPRVTERNADGGYKRIGSEFEQDTFRTEEHGLECPVDSRDAAVYAGMIDSEMVAAELTRHGVLEAHEQRVIALVDAITPVTADNEFDDDAAAITLDFVEYKQAFREQCGFAPTSLCLDSELVDYLMENGSVQDKFVGSQDRTARAITLKGLAAALGLDEVIEANGMKNTVASPKAFSLSSIWPRDKALLFRRSTAPTVLVPQFMRTIHWSGNGSRPGCVFEEYEEPQKNGKVLRHRFDGIEKVIYASCAMVLDGITTDP